MQHQNLLQRSQRHSRFDREHDLVAALASGRLDFGGGEGLDGDVEKRAVSDR